MWRRAVFSNAKLPQGAVDRDAYVLCVLEQLHRALNRRDVFAAPRTGGRTRAPSGGGVLLALLSAGSAVGGLTYGRISWRSTPVQRFAVLVTGFTLTVLPLCLTAVRVQC